LTYLFWDIDGTLLYTGRAGVIAWQDASREIVGHELDPQRLRTAGLTDFQIAERIVEASGQGGEALVSALVRRYESLLPAVLPLRVGRVLEGVREVLDFARECRPDVRSLLLTGNTRAGGRAKLTHYGLQDYFADGAFCEAAGERAAIARQALAFPGAQDAQRAGCLFVIGDTPHDVACGQAIGARTVAVASGEFGVDELARHEPWLVLERLPEPERFFEALAASRSARVALGTG
jgi:phosphoglycolate phosphatase-like HAD superfamily hydrolase